MQLLRGRDIFKRTVLGGAQAVCQYGIINQVKFSNDYVRAVFSGSIEGVLEGVKTGYNSVEDILMSASNKIANNIAIMQYQAEQQAVKQIVANRQEALLAPMTQEALAARATVDVEQYMKVLALEMFNKTGNKHFGGFDPYPGKKRSKSVPNRKTPK